MMMPDKGSVVIQSDDVIDTMFFPGADVRYISTQKGNTTGRL